MLDSTTKQLINSARDILVGKVPDPKSQIEQITLALIYKFMDDMDRETVEKLKGKPKFFAGKFAKYSWRNIFNPAIGGHEMLTLYAEALEKMNTNPGIHPFFREIFKNAFLPYRSPETLKLFLKTINEFNYDHSENLGNAYEYLLSILGTQGDAGQFRTPRHIIEFIVKMIDPQKHETILDPACGTAGFLLAAYKHILNANANKNPGDKLTPDDRKRLATNLTGYDIDPNMERFALVNMFLHGFVTPQIHEYDTLSSQDRWNEYYDVILANPPFMSPKGGIQPHNRFSVKSNRSEVLFVDYIAEHLAAGGRAGVIVPEGIIFQSGTAYKSLRKMLVEENYLVGVISLPAGVFNPYSGVKTSILWLDKTLAKKTDKILFVKIASDGFDLGAQRRSVKENDLTDALMNINAFKRSILKGEESNFDKISNFALVEKQQISKSGEYNLSGERYLIRLGIESNYEFVRIGDVFETSSGGTPLKSVKEYWNNGTIPWLKSGEVAQGFITASEDFITEDGLRNSSAKLFPSNSVLVAMYGATAGQVGLLKFESSTNQAVCAIFPNEKALPEFLYHIIKAKKDFLISQCVGGAQPNISQQIVRDLKIPLPPLSIQQELVSEIESYQKIIDGARQVIDNYKPRIENDSEWEMLELGEVCEINPKKSELKGIHDDTPVSFVPMSDVNENEMTFQVKEERKVGEVIKGYTYFQEDDVLVAKVTPCFENGKAGIGRNLKNGIGFGSSEYYVIRPNDKILSVWIYLNITSNEFRTKGKLQMTGTGGLQRVPKDFVSSFKIPLPDLPTQRSIVEQIEKEQALVKANKELIEVFNGKIKKRVEGVWGE